MVKILEGQLKSRGKKYGIVVSRFNDFITKNLLKECLKTLKKNGVSDKDITVVRVPGSVEIPVAALKLAKKKSIDGVICLGCVIRGETIHFDLVAQMAAQGISQIPLLTGKPVIFGVLAVDTVNQAYKRSKVGRGDNKGRDAALAAIEMVDVIAKIK